MCKKFIILMDQQPQYLSQQLFHKTLRSNFENEFVVFCLGSVIFYLFIMLIQVCYRQEIKDCWATQLEFIQPCLTFVIPIAMIHRIFVSQILDFGPVRILYVSSSYCDCYVCCEVLQHGPSEISTNSIFYVLVWGKEPTHKHSHHAIPFK